MAEWDGYTPGPLTFDMPGHGHMWHIRTPKSNLTVGAMRKPEDAALFVAAADPDAGLDAQIARAEKSERERDEANAHCAEVARIAESRGAEIEAQAREIQRLRLVLKRAEGLMSVPEARGVIKSALMPNDAA